MSFADLAKQTFDVLVVGTGLVPSLTAASVARAGKSVLHVDRNPCYGELESGLRLPELDDLLGHVGEAPGKPEDGAERITDWRLVHGETLIPLRGIDTRLARFFTVDLRPTLPLSNGPTVAALVTSQVHRYLEFRDLQRYLVATADSASGRPTISPVPCSKGDIFGDTSISLLDKRALMSLMQEVTDRRARSGVVAELARLNEAQLGAGRSLQRPQNKRASDSAAAAAATPEGAAPRTFAAFLAAHGLSAAAAAAIAHSVAEVQLPLEAATGAAGQVVAPCSEADGLARLERFVGSVGRFNPRTAHLTALYGASELSQAFCRLAAVCGSVYILRLQAPPRPSLVDAAEEAAGKTDHGGPVVAEEDAMPSKGAQAGGKRLFGLQMPDGAVLRGRQCVVSPAAVPEAFFAPLPSGQLQPATFPCVARCVALVRQDCALKAAGGEAAGGGAGRLVLSIPPGTTPVNNATLIQVVQADPSTACVPDDGGVVLWHVSSEVAGGAEAALKKDGSCVLTAAGRQAIARTTASLTAAVDWLASRLGEGSEASSPGEPACEASGSDGAEDQAAAGGSDGSGNAKPIISYLATFAALEPTLRHVCRPMEPGIHLAVVDGSSSSSSNDLPTTDALRLDCAAETKRAGALASLLVPETPFMEQPAQPATGSDEAPMPGGAPAKPAFEAVDPFGDDLDDIDALLAAADGAAEGDAGGAADGGGGAGEAGVSRAEEVEAPGAEGASPGAE